MKTKKLLSIILAIVLMFSTVTAAFLHTVADDKKTFKVIDAISIGKNSAKHQVANVFYPLTALNDGHGNKFDDSTYFKLTFKAKMLSGSSPIVGYIKYNKWEGKGGAIYAMPDNVFNGKGTNADPNCTYSYDEKTGLCEVVFKPVIDEKTIQGTNGVYGWLTIGNSEYKFRDAEGKSANGGEDKNIDEADFDNAFIMSEPELHAFDGEKTYGDNLVNGFEEENVDFAGTYNMWWNDYGRNDSLEFATVNKWHINNTEYLIDAIKVPSDYLEENYDADNFVKSAETDYVREYYTNENYPEVYFAKLKNSDDKAFKIIEDINKKMIIIEANNESGLEGEHAAGIANRCANLILPTNVDQYLQTAGNLNAGNYVYLRVDMNVRRLEGDANSAPLLGRMYGTSEYEPKANGTYVDNYGVADNVESNAAGEAKSPSYNKYGVYRGYVRMYTCSSDQATKCGHTEFLTIGNAEHNSDNDRFDATWFNSTFAITNIKVSIIKTDNNNPRSLTSATPAEAENIAPELVAENLDLNTPRYYRAYKRMYNSNIFGSNSGKTSDEIEAENIKRFLPYDVLSASQKKWSVDGACDLITSCDVTPCMTEISGTKPQNKKFSHTLTYHGATDSSLEYWTCDKCINKKFADQYGSKVLTDDDIKTTKKMLVVNGSDKIPTYATIPLKIRGFEGTGYYKFSCKMKLNNTDAPKITPMLARREGEPGGANRDGDTYCVSQTYDAENMILTAVIQVWRPYAGAYERSDHLPFFYTEPNTGSNLLLLIGNAEPIGAGYNANTSSFAITDPEFIRLNGKELSSGIFEGATNIMAPITDKTVDLDNDYVLGGFESYYYTDVNSPLCGPTNVWSKIGNKTTVTDIPDKYFMPSQGLNIENANAKVTTFTTIEAGKQYKLSFNGKFESSLIAKPYIEFFDKSGKKSVEYLEYQRDVDGQYNISSDFTAPKNLRDTKNVRVGIDIDSTDIKGLVSNFELREANKNGTYSEKNYIYNGAFADMELNDIGDYSDTVGENIWTKEGNFGNTKFEYISFTSFIKPAPKMVAFSGRNTSDCDPSEAKLTQKFTIVSGKKYRLTYNARYVLQGISPYGFRLGGYLQYIKDGQSDYSYLPNNKTDSTTEYRETFDFTAPNDISTSSNNFLFTFYFSGAFVSGYIANFELHEVDEQGNIVGDNMFVMGDFAGGNYYPGWDRSSYDKYGVFSYNDIPENLFSKTKSYTKKMVYLHNTSDYAGMLIEPMYEPGATYEFSYDYLITDYADEDTKPYSTASQFRRVDGTIVNDSMSNSEFTTTETPYNPNNAALDPRNSAYHVKKVFTMSNDMRLYGKNNMIIRFYMRSASAGFWGNFGIYKLDNEGNRISGNLFINGDFICGTAFWDKHGTITPRIVDMPDGFFENYAPPVKMIYSNGSESNSLYKTNLSLDATKEYNISLKYVGMNSNGATPQVLYKTFDESGNETYKEIATEPFYDADRYVYDYNFTIPFDAIKKNGKVDVIVQMNNNTKGKAYFTNLMLSEVGKYENLLSNFSYSTANYQELPYDKEVFVFYYDDARFDDGDWSGELSSQATEEITYGNITGTLVDYDYESLSGVTMKLMPGNITVKTDELGEFNFENLKPGNYKLYLVDGKKDIFVSDIVVKKGMTYNVPTISYGVEEVELDDEGEYESIVKSKNSGILRGIYYNRYGKPKSGVKIHLTKSVYAVTDKDGKFEFENIVPGKHKIYASIDGSFYLVKEANVQAGKIILVKVLEPDLEDDGFFANIPLAVYIAVGAGLLVLIAGGVVLIILLKKKKKEVAA